MILALLATAVVGSGDPMLENRLGWMAGAWVQKNEDGKIQETWLAPTDGVMAGVSQTQRVGRKPFIEYMKMSQEPAGLTFTAILSGQPPTPFCPEARLRHRRRVRESRPRLSPARHLSPLRPGPLRTD